MNVLAISQIAKKTSANFASLVNLFLKNLLSLSCFYKKSSCEDFKYTILKINSVKRYEMNTMGCTIYYDLIATKLSNIVHGLILKIYQFISENYNRKNRKLPN